MDCSYYLNMCVCTSAHTYIVEHMHWMNSSVLKSQGNSQFETMQLYKEKGAYDLVLLYVPCLDLNKVVDDL